MPSTGGPPEGHAAQDAVLLNIGAVAQLFGCSSRHVSRMADAGQMPRPLRLGKLMRWSRDAIETWIARGCPPSAGGSERR